MHIWTPTPTDETKPEPLGAWIVVAATCFVLALLVRAGIPLAQRYGTIAIYGASFVAAVLVVGAVCVLFRTGKRDAAFTETHRVVKAELNLHIHEWSRPPAAPYDLSKFDFDWEVLGYVCKCGARAIYQGPMYGMKIIQECPMVDELEGM
jgi:hypothetical protein